MLLCPLPLPTDKCLYYFPNEVWEELILCQYSSCSASSPETEGLTIFTFVAHVFHYNQRANSSVAITVTCAWMNLHPAFPKQFLVITLITGRAIFFSICSYCCPKYLQLLAGQGQGQETQTINAVSRSGLTSIKKKKKSKPVCC